MEKRIDLHIHTTASDGSVPPAETVALAKELGLAAIAVTDHDTVDGVQEAVDAGNALGIEIIPGVEFSADYRGGRAHILGLFIDPASDALRDAMTWAVKERIVRNERIVAAMARDGMDISMETLGEEYPDAVLGRPHIAEHLVRKGVAASVADAFRRYLIEGTPYYFSRRRMSLEQAADYIRGAGGLPIIAHPFQYGYNEEKLLAYIDTCRAAGCVGLEAYYSEHTPGEQDYLLALAGRKGMLVSGGSDWHGTRKPHIRMGSGIAGGLCVPYSVLQVLKDHIAG